MSFLWNNLGYIIDLKSTSVTSQQIENLLFVYQVLFKKKGGCHGVYELCWKGPRSCDWDSVHAKQFRKISDTVYSKNEPKNGSTYQHCIILICKVLIPANARDIIKCYMYRSTRYRRTKITWLLPTFILCRVVSLNPWSSIIYKSILNTLVIEEWICLIVQSR